MHKKIFAALLAVSAALASWPARATLGEAVSPSSAVGAQAPFAARQLQQGEGYGVILSQDAAGRRIREFSRPDGVVFAVAWQGASLPDLRALLGRYFPGYVQAGEQNKHGLNVLRSQRGELVVEQRGRMGAFQGYAYVPGLVPANVDMATLR